MLLKEQVNVKMMKDDGVEPLLDSSQSPPLMTKSCDIQESQTDERESIRSLNIPFKASFDIPNLDNPITTEGLYTFTKKKKKNGRQKGSKLTPSIMLSTFVRKTRSKKKEKDKEIRDISPWTSPPEIRWGDIPSDIKYDINGQEICSSATYSDDDSVGYSEVDATEFFN
jgi:hypothetical protein